MRRLASNLGLLVAALLAAFVLCEAALRVAGFHFDVRPESIEFGWPDPEQRATNFEPDPDLFWVPRGYGRTIEALKQKGAQLVFLGDSCTHMGQYPDLTAARLRAAHPELHWRAVKLGVAGWSSHQGLRQLERDVLPARPAVVTIYFGWNDHWIGFGLEDDEIGGIRLPGIASLRTVQLLSKALAAWRSSRRGEHPNRVPPDDFEANLREMTRLAREGGIVPVLLTAPSGHEEGFEPPYLAERYLRDLHDLIPLHRQYVEIVRKVAAEEGVLLCDLAASFDAMPAHERRNHFRRDGIHLRQLGDERIAELLSECLLSDDAVREAWKLPPAAGQTPRPNASVP